MNYKYFLFNVLVNLVISQQAIAVDKTNIHEKIKTLETQIQLSTEQQTLWRDTEKLLSQAKQHLSANELQETNQLIEKIHFQISQGKKQADEQNDISTLVPYYLK